MIRIHTCVSVVAILGAALGGTVAGTGGIAVAASADDPITFERNSAAPRQAATLGDQYFHVEWTAEAVQPGISRLTGYVYNDYGEAAQDVDLQITTVNAAGQPRSTGTASAIVDSETVLPFLCIARSAS